MRRIVLAAALLALVAVGCKAELNLVVDLEADGSGTLELQSGFDDEFIQLVFQGQDPAEAVQDNDFAELENAEFDTYEEGEFTFYRITVPFTDPAEVLQAAADDVPVEAIEVTVTDDEVRVSAQTQEGVGDLVGSDDLQGFSPDVLADTISLHVRLRMPGEVTSTNADRTLPDGTLEWDVPLTGAGLDIQAVSDPTAGSGDGLPLGLVAGGAAVLAAGAAAGVWLVRRRRQPEPPDTAALVDAPVGAPLAGGAAATEGEPVVPAVPAPTAAPPEETGELPEGEEDETPPIT